jgi:hypothetical protein
VAPESLPFKVQRSPVLTTMLDSWRAPISLSKSENARFPTEGRKAVICYSVDSTRRPTSPKCTEAQHFPPHLPTRRVQSLLSKSWNSSSSTESQSTTLQIPGGWPPKVHRGPALPTVSDSGRALTPLLKSENSRFPTEGRKAVTCYSAGTSEGLLPQGT